jgi:hypothetical protein
MAKHAIAVALLGSVLFSATAYAGGGGGGGAGGAGGAGGGASGAAGSSGSMSGSAGTGNTSTGIGTSTGASAQNTVGQPNRNPISPSNPATTAPGGANSQPVPAGTVTNQDPQNYDPRLSPGYQK